MDNTVEVIDVTKRYPTGWALNQVSALFPKGCVIGLLGHNGAGKSTLIKLILGLISPSTGQIRLFGCPPEGHGSRKLRAGVAYLPENVAFYGSLTGREVIEYFAALKQVPRQQGWHLLERTGLTEAANRRVSTYSKGMRQRLGLAQALLGAPELLLLDEPTTGLDPMATLDFYALIGELKAEGKTIIISSHLLAELEPHLDHAVILGHGCVLAQGTVEQMRESAGLPVTISVRTAGEGMPEMSSLSELGVTVRSQWQSHVELDVPAGNKLLAVRELMKIPALTDIDVREPTLASLYARLGTT